MIAAPMRIVPYLRLLRTNPAFGRLYAAQLTSFAGDWFATVALIGLAYELSGSAAVASLVLVLQTGGFALASPVAGMLADRFDRRLLLVGSTWRGCRWRSRSCSRASPTRCGSHSLRSCCSRWPRRSSSPPRPRRCPNLVDDEDLPTANVLVGSAWGTMLAVGAGLGGIVAATLGRDAAFLINAASFAVSAWLILGIRRPLQAPPDSVESAAVPGGIGAAITFARSTHQVAAFLLSKTSFGVGTGVIALYAVFGRDVFEAGDAGIGVLFAARGLGALVGPFVARAVMGTDDRGLVRGIAVSFALAAGGYLVFPLSPALWVAAACVFAAHCGGGAQWTLSTLGLQRATPDGIRGRVFSLDYGLVTLTIAVSTLAAGVLADAFPPRVAVWVMAGLIVAAGIAWIAFSRPLLTGRAGGRDGRLDGR